MIARAHTFLRHPPLRQTAVERPSSGFPVPSLYVLVVDDIESVRRLVRRVLEHADHRVLEAANGLEALARLAENPTVDLVITDLRMPKMDGWELATRLAGRSPRLPVLFMSGFD